MLVCNKHGYDNVVLFYTLTGSFGPRKACDGL